MSAVPRGTSSVIQVAVEPEAELALALVPSGQRALLAEFGALLASSGVERGLIGPREVGRLWGRHILNCLVTAELLPADGEVADVGSGAGLPGLVLAIARPQTDVTLIEPLLRRSSWLSSVVGELGVGNVTVVRARAQDVPARTFHVVTARAVAPLGTLLPMCLPLLRPLGTLLALKGAAAAAEVAEADAGGRDPRIARLDIVRCGVGLVDPPTTVVSVVRASG